MWLAAASELGAGLAVSLAAAAAAAAAVGTRATVSWIARNDGAGECDTRDEPSAGDTALSLSRR